MIFLHIGTHKTGSKSLQRFLFDHTAQLAASGYDLYKGSHKNPTNHRELLLGSCPWTWCRSCGEVARRCDIFLGSRRDG